MSHMGLNTSDDSRLRLAQELLDSILDHLHYDPESLKRCALASRSLLPTCQRHLFSTYQITESNVSKLANLFTPPVSTDRDDESETLRTRVADLFDTYTDNLILTGPVRKGNLPEFKNAQKITFRGDELNSAVTIPSFLKSTWASPSSKIRSVEFDFRFMSQRGVLQSLCVLPTVVEDVSFTGSRPQSTRDDLPTAASIRRYIEDQLPSGHSHQEPRQFNGTLKLRLPTDISEDLLSVVLELGDCFKFKLKRINYRLTLRSEIPHLASLADKCKTTLKSLDITVSFPILRRYSWGPVASGSFDFSQHRALRSIRIWTPANFNPAWLSDAISSIPTPSSANPRVPPLRIELHISLPEWMMHPQTPGPRTSEEVDRLAAAWIPVDTQLSRLMVSSPDTPSAKSVKDGTSTGILLDVTVPDLAAGPGVGIAALMFPLLRDVEGLVRLV